MENASYYHVCADGSITKNFIISEEEFRVAFNLVGVCAANSKPTILAFALEDSHPHFLLKGTYDECADFKEQFEASYKRYLSKKRDKNDGIMLDCDILAIKDNDYLLNTGTYIVIQPTKDGKKVMPHDYKWSSGPLYFRSAEVLPIWHMKDGKILETVKVRDITIRQRNNLFHTRKKIPADWSVCDGLILPDNYVDVKAFEALYQTHNRFRVYLASKRAESDAVHLAIINETGIWMEDMEIRKPCGDLAKKLFGSRDIRKLNAQQRIKLGMELRKLYRVSKRQLATLIRLPYGEVEKHIK